MTKDSNIQKRSGHVWQVALSYFWRYQGTSPTCPPPWSDSSSLGALYRFNGPEESGTEPVEIPSPAQFVCLLGLGVAAAGYYFSRTSHERLKSWRLTEYKSVTSASKRRKSFSESRDYRKPSDNDPSDMLSEPSYGFSEPCSSFPRTSPRLLRRPSKRSAIGARREMARFSCCYAAAASRPRRPWTAPRPPADSVKMKVR